MHWGGGLWKDMESFRIDSVLIFYRERIFVKSFISLLLLHTNIISGVRTNIPPKSQFGSCPLRPPSSRRQWTAWPACSVCWGQVLCHHWGTRAPVPAIMLDYWLPAENSFMLDYSVMRRAGSLSLTKKILKKNHKETPIDRRGCSLLWVYLQNFNPITI